MYMCRYVFIGAVLPTPVEMDLTFVCVVRFTTLDRYWKLYRLPFHSSVCTQSMNELT